jgi:hypothetical protein
MADENDVEETEDELDEEFEEDEFADEEELDEVDEAVGEDVDDDEAAATDEEEEEEEEGDLTPRTSRKRPSGEEEDEDEDEDDDDVEADLDTILKDRIAAGDDLEDEEEEEVPDRNDPDASDGVTAKKEGEFTCTNCFLIVHPRQFGRRDNPQCPEGYDPCPSEAIVRAMR